jgi:hypothetical protein
MDSAIGKWKVESGKWKVRMAIGGERSAESGWLDNGKVEHILDLPKST